uniref:Uncharacterized protein n=1 Tax=Rhizophora mucronata TaxID=61149 RepID=A0A2P2P1I6_RHIMU
MKILSVVKEASFHCSCLPENEFFIPLLLSYRFSALMHAFSC